MNVGANECVERLLSGCNRIVLTMGFPFDPKHKKRNAVLADIRDAASIESVKDVLVVDPSSPNPSWMSPVDLYVAFVDGKCVIGSVGIVLRSWLRSEDWDGDYAVKDHHKFENWLRSHGVSIESLGRAA
jgi:hypothetical protein